MWLMAVALSALAAAIAEDQQRSLTRSVDRRRLTGPVGPGMMMSKRTHYVILLDGEPKILIDVSKVDEGAGFLEVEDLESGEEEEYHVFESEDLAGKIARENVKSELLYGIDSDDPRKRASAAQNAVELLGAENLVLWALGQPAGPGYTKVRSLDEWLDLHTEDPGLSEYWSPETEASSEIEPDEEDFTEGRVLLGESAWDNMVQKLGFEPEIAYKR